eukprot:COSAG04_NODE_23602_length_335_cov_1.076271_1_plen_95_part_01
MSETESRALLVRLLRHTTERRFTATHEWAVGDVVLWENALVLHRADLLDSSQRCGPQASQSNDLPYISHGLCILRRISWSSTLTISTGPALSFR